MEDNYKLHKGYLRGVQGSSMKLSKVICKVLPCYLVTMFKLKRACISEKEKKNKKQLAILFTYTHKGGLKRVTEKKEE